jgi:predicted DNA-binding protein (MmcQ/YjbR family)
MPRAPSPDRTLRRLRRLCLSLPDVTEAQSWGHPNFRVGKRTFATFEVYRGRPSIAVKVEAGVEQLLIDDVRFFRTPYGGNRGWVSAWVDGDVDWTLLKDLVRRAHTLVAPARAAKQPAVRTRPRGGRTHTRRRNGG